MKKTIFILIFSLIFKTDINSQQVKCFWCGGSGKEQKWIDPELCQNCVTWNSSYRRKVACGICKDTRLTPNRRYSMVTCRSCKGTGRDYDQEARNNEFGNSKYLLSNHTIYQVNGMKVHQGYWRSRTGSDDNMFGLGALMTYSRAIENCESLGNGWRIPTFDELNQLFRAQKNGQYNLGFDGRTKYWTSTDQSRDGRLKYILAEETVSGYGSYVDIGNSYGDYAGSARCKCVNSDGDDNSISDLEPIDPPEGPIKNAISKGCLSDGIVYQSRSTGKYFFRAITKKSGREVDFFPNMTYRFTDNGQNGVWKCDK